MIVTDEGLYKHTKSVQMTEQSLKEKMKNVSISDTKANPSVTDVLNITKTYLENGCDNIVALGGGVREKKKTAKKKFFTNIFLKN